MTAYFKFIEYVIKCDCPASLDVWISHEQTSYLMVTVSLQLNHSKAILLMWPTFGIHFRYYSSDLSRLNIHFDTAY